MVGKGYSYSYACRVIDAFWKDKSRGLEILGRIYGNVNKDHAVDLFRFNQKRWNVFKKLVKLCDRLADSGMFDFEFIKKRCLTSVKYYLDYEEGKTWHQVRKAGILS